ncbi:MAG: ABC transporter permease [Mesorhizobium sp.]
MIDTGFLVDTTLRLLGGLPLTLQLVALSILIGTVLGYLLAIMRLSGWLPSSIASAYVFVFRGTPLLVQLFIIYYGLSQFESLRHSFVWPYLRQAYWCAVLALALNTAAYSSEIIRGGLLSVPAGEVEAGRAIDMTRLTLYRRIVLPLAIRQLLPAYSNEVILMVKSTSLASTITMMEITGISAKIISSTFRPVEVFICAGAIYLALNFLIAKAFHLLERHLSPADRSHPSKHAARGDAIA